MIPVTTEKEVSLLLIFLPVRNGYAIMYLGPPESVELGLEHLFDLIPKEI